MDQHTRWVSASRTKAEYSFVYYYLLAGIALFGAVIAML